jgi:hypothetical protein
MMRKDRRDEVRSVAGGRIEPEDWVSLRWKRRSNYCAPNVGTPSLITAKFVPEGFANDCVKSSIWSKTSIPRSLEVPLEDVSIIGRRDIK